MLNNKTKLCTLALLFALLANSYGQIKSDYWQQTVNYKIEVSLNDTEHELDGFANIQYINNSPDALSKIVFHLWPNAYSSDASAFAKHKLENRSTDFYFSKAEERGNISNLAFEVNGKAVEQIANNEHADIVEIKLSKVLQPGDSIEITTPFKVKIPVNFSRLGRDGTSYQISQWYPKPAVYDKNGWHAMPYLNQGEFYADFGNYDVTITLPENYIVAATGELQTQAEIEMLTKAAAKTARSLDFINLKGKFNPTEFPASSATTKTITFKQDSVIDFAWFADKRFNVLKSEVELSSGKKVNTWAFFTNKSAKQWAKATSFLNDAVKFYSDHVGEYPYNICTAVEGTLIAGGGMEYPTITIIGGTGNEQSLDRVIAHEVGHNWFQGILATNERDFPYMDEGINSYYENRYMDEKYPDAGLLPEKLNSKISKTLNKQLGFENKKLSYQNELGYMLSCRVHADQACNLHSADYTNLNYGVVVYWKTAIAFKYLESFLGREGFDEIMKKYFEQWKFKHPYPKDLRTIFESNSNKYLDWFFDEVLANNQQMDYAMLGKDANRRIGNSDFNVLFVKNKGGVRSPFPVTAIKNKKPVKTIWYDGFGGTSEILFPKIEADEFVIDYDNVTTETHRKNNNLKLNGLLKKMEKPRLSALFGLENPAYNQLFFMPLTGYNYWDKYMLGIGLNNGVLPAKNLEWFAAPMWSFKTNSLVGFAKANYYKYLKSSSKIKNVRVSLGVKSFHDFENTEYASNPDSTILEKILVNTTPSRFIRISPELQLNFAKPNARSSVSSSLSFRHINIMRDNFDCPYGAESDTICGGFPLRNESYYINELKYVRKNSRVINPYGYEAMAEQGSGYIKLAAKANYKLTYLNDKKGLKFKAYASWFPSYTNPNNRIAVNSLSYRSKTDNFDYKLDHFVLGRNKSINQNKYNLIDYQTILTDAGFKSNTDEGRNNKFLSTINVTADVPVLPAYLYVNTGLFTDRIDATKLTTGLEIGIALSLISDALEIYFPIKLSENISGTGNLKYYEKITFLVNINRLDLFKMARNNSLFN